jgi:thymidylate synthase ThyX
MKTTINAQIVAHSVNEQGDELISVLATFPRIILAEVNTHRMLSKNTSSSRAIPFHKMVETIQNDPFIPIAWQRGHSGMQGNEYLTAPIDLAFANDMWLEARDRAVRSAKAISKEGTDGIPFVTKQLANRLLEPFMWTTMLITGPKSGWDNFFNLRCPQYECEGQFFRSKKDAIKYFKGVYQDILIRRNDLDWLQANQGQAEIHMMALAECIWDAVSESTPKVLKAGEWHIPFEDKMAEPFFKTTTDENGTVSWIPLPEVDEGAEKWIQEQKVKVSVAMAARTSYTVVGEEKGINYEAMIGLHDRLLAWDPPHSSPLEHCARAMSEQEDFHFTKTRPAYSEEEKAKGNEVVDFGWCNNFKGFVPYRYMVDNGIEI